MKPAKVGVIGTGHMGTYHVRTLSEISNVELTGVVDIDSQRAETIANQYGTTPYHNYQELFDKVEGVSIAVPTKLHYQVAKDCLEAGLHVLLEKPMTQNLEEAKELFDLAVSKQRILQVGHVERFNAAVQELKNIVRNPIFIECRRLGPYSSNGRIKDSGVVLDLLIHDIDIVLSLVNSRLERINVAGASVYSEEHEDVANVQLVFANGCIGNLTASRITENKIRTLSITQPDAYIYLDYADQDLHIHRQAASKYILSREVMRYKQESFIERLFVHKDNPLKLELIHFINCFANGGRSRISPEEELNSLSVTLKVLDLIKEGKRKL